MPYKRWSSGLQSGERHDGDLSLVLSFIVRGLVLSPNLQIDNTFFFNDTATTEIYTLSLHDALPILDSGSQAVMTLQQSQRKRFPAPSPWPLSGQREIIGGPFPIVITREVYTVLSPDPSIAAVPNPGPQGTPVLHVLHVSLLQHTWFKCMGRYQSLQKPAYDHSFESGVL